MGQALLRRLNTGEKVIGTSLKIDAVKATSDFKPTENAHSMLERLYQKLPKGIDYHLTKVSEILIVIVITLIRRIQNQQKINLKNQRILKQMKKLKRRIIKTNFRQIATKTKRVEAQLLLHLHYPLRKNHILYCTPY